MNFDPISWEFFSKLYNGLKYPMDGTLTNSASFAVKVVISYTLLSNYEEQASPLYPYMY